MIFLRFPDEATGMAALRSSGFLRVDESGAEQVITATHSWAIDVIGTICTPGTYDPETGDELTPPVPLPGWHVNYIGDLPEAWADYVVTPVQPVRVWA